MGKQLIPANNLRRRDRSSRPAVLAAAFLTGWSVLAADAWADDSNKPKPQTEAAPQPAADAPPPSIADSIPALAGAAAFKKRLKDLGLTLQMTYMGEILANVSGGRRQGAIYDGRLEFMLEADMEKIANWQGGTLHVDGYWIQGTGLSRYYVNNLLDVSYIEALPTVRLYELWYEQKLADNKLALRAGLLGADSDFVSSKYAQLFVNATTGWPEIFSGDMPSGGPAYPFSAMGFRAKYDANDNFSLVAAIYDGNPAGPGTNDPQRRNPYGLNFRLSDPALLMQEAQFKYNQDKGSTGLAGQVKLGAWEHLGSFPDNLYDGSGQPFVLSGLSPASLPGNYGAYAMIDQQIFKAPDDPTKGVGVFARVFVSPEDRNLINFYFDTGVNVAGLVRGRGDDVFGLSFAYAQISNSVRRGAFYSGLSPLPDHEALLEMTYQAQIMPGWTAQPVAEFVIHPNARLNGTDYPNAAVFGIRTTVSY
jgi:porin